jgi:hypothetical protein
MKSRTASCKYVLTSLQVCALLLTVGRTTGAESREPFKTDPAQPVLLLGESTVARTSQLKQTFFAAQKHPANPVLRRTEPWEGVGPYVFGNRLMQDAATKQFRLWYIAYRYEDNHYRWGLATSDNGLEWAKPQLDIEQFANQPAKNCLPLGPHPEKATRSIARDPRPETPAERRYLGVRFTYDGEFVSFSPDGVAWTERPENPVWHVPSDIIHVTWDDRRQRFIAYFKVWELKGRQVQPDGPHKDASFTAHMPFFTPKDLGDGTTEFTGPCITFNPPREARIEQRRFILRSGDQGADDGGGTSLSGAWNAKRIQAFAESEDGIHWTKEQIVLRADGKDPRTANIQYFFVMPYGGYYVGFANMHDEGGHFRIQLAWSADGIAWHRPWREPWLDIAPGGAFDAGMVLGPADPIIQEREMWFPYGGFPIRHDSKETNWESAIGLATTRLDGFAAWEAGDTEGELVTQPFRFTGDRLLVNADARGGSLAVEVLDARGNPLKGFEAGACQTISQDTLTHSGSALVHWHSKYHLSALQGQQIQLRFILRHAKVFSFRLADEHTKSLPVPRATDR